MNWPQLIVLVVIAAITAGVVALVRAAFMAGTKDDKNVLREKILPNILTISTYVFILAIVALAADIWAMWAVFASVEGIIQGTKTVTTDLGTTETVVNVALVTDFIIKALTAFTFHTVAMTALTGLIMIMKDVATAPPSETDGMKGMRLLAGILRDKLGLDRDAA